MPAFDLIEEPFLPCRRTNGEFTEYGLRAVLEKAHEISELRDASPLVTVALHRLLLAILHRCYEGPKKTSARIAIRNAAQFDAKHIARYFEKWSDRFDLFHEKYPFYQRAGFKTAEPSGINRLAQELSRGNNAALFDHTTDDPPPPVRPAKTARLVIAEQSFAVGGGKSDTGSTTHAPLVSGAIVLVRGETLFETLWLNLVIYDGSVRPVACDLEDAPVWERQPTPPDKLPATPFGYLDYLTWQSRTLCVHPTIEREQVVVRHVSYAQGRKCEPETGFFNPMVGFTRKGVNDPFQPVRFNEYRDLWRDSAVLYQIRDLDNKLDRAPLSLVEIAGDELRKVLRATARYKLSVFGLCTDKAKVNFWRHESLPLPLAYLDNPELVESLKRALKLAEEVATDALHKAAWATVANRLTGDSGMNPDKKRVQSLLDSFAPEPLYWSRLELPYRELLVDLAATITAEERSTLIATWFWCVLHDIAMQAFDNSVGRIDGGRDLKATTAGDGMLRRFLASVQRNNRVADRELQGKEGAT